MSTPLRARRAPLFLAFVLLPLVLAALAPLRAHAALPVTFDALADGVLVQNEFAADGIVFEDPAGANTRPVVTTVGTKAFSGTKVAVSNCFACEFQTNLVRGRLTSPQQNLSMRVGITGTSGPTGGETLTLRGLRTNGTQAAVTTIVNPSAASFGALMSVSSAAPDIAFFEISIPGGWQFGIDDVTFSGGGGPPDFAVVPTTSLVRIRQGGTAQVPVDVFRFDGSNGNIAFSSSGLPSGVTQSSITPSVLTGTNEGTPVLTLSASPSAPTFDAPASFTFTGSNGANVSVAPADRTASVSVVVEPAFRVTLPTEIALPSCASTTVNVNVTRAFSGFSDEVDLAVGALPAGYTATLAQTSVGAPSGGAFANQVPLTITRTTSGSMTPFNISVTGSSGSLPTSTATSQVQRFAGEVTAVTPATGTVPHDTAPGSAVAITGRGLCAGAQVRFGNSSATVSIAAADLAEGGTVLNTRIPRLATNGPVTVVAPDGSFSSAASLTITSPRNTEGFQFENYNHPGVSLDDLRYVYGESQVNITVDLCWPLGCDVVTPIPSPFAALYMVIANGALSGKGSCYGIAVTAQQLVSGRVPYSRFQAGATTVHQLASTSGPDSAALRKHIRGWHNTQLSSQAIQNYVATATGNLASGGSGVRAKLESELRAGRSPLLMLKQGLGGHVMVVNDVRDAGGGNYRIDVYDPNLPFEAAENTDGPRHVAREDASTVVVSSSGSWTMVGAYGGSGWSGGPGSLIHMPFGSIPSTPTLPSTLTGLLSLIVPFASGGATTTQVTTAGGDKLLDADGTLNTDAATGIKGAEVMPSMSGNDSTPVYLVPAGGVYTQQIEGTRTGTVQAGMIGPGFGGVVSGIKATKGSDEAVTFDKKGGSIGVHSTHGGAFHAQLASSRTESAEFGATIKVGGGDKGDHEFALDPAKGGVGYENGGGPATVAMSLTYANDGGTPGAATLPAVPVPAGGSVNAKPVSWAKLDTAGVALTVRTAGGRVVVNRVVQPAKTIKRVSSVTATARTVRGTTRQVKVTAKYLTVPKTAKVFVTVQVRAGAKVVETKRIEVPASAARGTKSYPFAFTLPTGTYSIRSSVGVVTGTAANLRTSRVTRTIGFVAR